MFTLNEGLHANDLDGMVASKFSVDTYKSKMGDDKDVCVLGFSAKDRAPANDMMEFIERGYSFVLDSDISSGEDDAGRYVVFVEITRDENLAKNIMTLIDGLKRLVGDNKWEFKFYRHASYVPASLDSLSIIPNSPKTYEEKMNQHKMEGVRHFFNKTLMDSLVLDGDIITINKPYGSTIKLQMVSDTELLEDTATDNPEQVFWLSKVLGDYDISQHGDSFIFKNGQETMTLRLV